MSYQLIEKLKSLKPYDPIYGEYKIRLDANESFLHLDAETIQKITDGIAKMDFNRYPDHNAAIACNAFAQFYGVDAQYVTVGNGLDESISLLISCFLNKGDTLMILAPDFAMYEIYARLYEVEPYVYQKGEDLTIDVEDVIAKAKAKNVQMLMFSNPCNPTSIGLDKQDVIRLIEALPDTLVVVDEAYMDFWDEGMSMLKSAHAYPNLMVLRTCSKAVGSASIRMGFVVSDFTKIRALKAAKSPYNVNGMTQIAAQVILSEHEKLRQNIAQIKASREDLYAKMLALQARKSDILFMPKPDTNFVFPKVKNAKAVFEALQKKSIAVRYMGEHLRITCGTEQENAAVVAALDEILQ